MPTIPEALEIARGHHQAGRLDAAEEIYKRILGVQPKHAEAFHLLGLVASQRGSYQVAVEHIARAIKLDPSEPVFHVNLAEAYRGLGRADKAQSCYRKALALAPNLAAAHNNLGTLLQAQGNLDEAMELYRTAIALESRYADAHNNLGIALQAQGQWDAAIDAFRRALAIEPRYAAAHNNLGVAFHALGRLDEAVAELSAAVGLDEEYAEARYALARVLQDKGLAAQAEANYRAAIGRRPTLVDAHNALGTLYQAQGNCQAAEACFREALRLQPDFAGAHYNLGTIFQQQQQQLDRAAAQYRRAVELEPRFADAHYNLGVVFTGMGKLDEAIAAYEQAVVLRPDFALAHNNLANAYLVEGRGSEAMASYRRAMASSGAGPIEHGNMLYAMNFLPQFDVPTIFAEHLAWARRYAEPLTARAQPHRRADVTTRRLRIGYVSPHFCRHAVTFFIEPVLAAHDRGSFEVYAYSDLRIAPDDVTKRIQASCEHWREVATQTDEELCERVRADRIDILVDLTGHVGGNRLLMFARKSAPVQVAYLGYQNTTGMSAMDYRLTDERADPPGRSDDFYTEKLVRLPRSFFCYRPPDEAPPVGPLPALASGRVTFGSFNNFAKVGPRVIDAWFEILDGVPNSRLLVLACRGSSVEGRLRTLARERGIDPARIELFDQRPIADYLRLVAEADIALDSFPFNGHTTTCDSIWMGVPVVMLEGQSYASRFGGSVLANVGLEDQIVPSADRYVRRVIELAGDLAGLARLRDSLRSRMAASPLLDFAGFTRNLEQAYRTMWQTWCGS
jgi:protein O-GlcNAc transferase